MTLVSAPIEPDVELDAQTPHPGVRVVAVVEGGPSSTAVARCAARLAEEHNCRLTIVVTWNDLAARLLACSWLVLPISWVDAAGWECDSASERARELRKVIGERPGLTHYARKGRPRAVAGELARNHDCTTIVVGSWPSAIGDWPGRLWPTFRKQGVAVLPDRATRNPTRGASVGD